MDVRNVFDVLGAGASVAAIVGVIIQLYLLRRDARERATVPAAVPEQPPANVATTPTPGPPASTAPTTSEPPSTIGAPPRPSQSADSAAPIGSARVGDSGWGAFFMGAWLVLVIITVLGWAIGPEEALGGSDLTRDEAVTSLWYIAAALFVNTVWAALLAWRHRPRAGVGPGAGRPLRTAKDRFWIYLFAAVASPVVAVLLIPAIGVLRA
jgi:hypothetical protein